MFSYYTIITRPIYEIKIYLPQNIFINNKMINTSPRIFFLFKTPGPIYHIVEAKDVQNIPKPRELIRRATSPIVIREFAKKEGIEIYSDTARKEWKLSKETRAKMSEAKKGENHPHKDGISEKHRQSIIKALKGKRGGENNNMHGRRQSAETRKKMSLAWLFRVPQKWITRYDGKTTKIPKTQKCPHGWQLGRFYDKYKPEELSDNP